MKKSKIKIVLIGCGKIGKRHAEHINNLAELTAVCDIKEDRAKEFANKYKCNYYTSINDLLLNENNFDIASICTPNYLHSMQTISFLKAGKHVLCEKPMALSVKDCKLMIQEEKKSKKKIFIVKQNRFNPPVKAVKDAIEKNKLGRIFNVQINCFWNRNRDYYKNSDWKGRKNLDGGVLFTQFTHFIDLIYWLIGDVKNIYSIKKKFLSYEELEFEDTGVVLLEFKTGAIGSINFTINSFKTNFEGSITIFGEKGTVKIGGQYLNTVEYQKIDNFRFPDLNESRPPNDYGYYTGSMSNHDKVYQNIIEVLQNNGTISTSSFEGMQTIELIEKIYNS